ncbi:MAG: RagB/SusD family nutrient uptake outer membrane protein [Prevotellaceae bacterium]|nr:RagB/SusD family nutrient uptake outer membrane protein [Prevotellaceae bacterium]
MKKIINIYVIVALFSLSSCGDFLEVDPQNVITLEQFWNEKSDVENVIAGCYSGMQSYGYLSRIMIWGEFRSENVINNGTIERDVNLERVLKGNLTANNAYTSWADFYSIINRCNIAMLYAPQVAAKDPAYAPTELKAHIAELTAIRSLCYFYLIRTFRDVPYTEEAFLSDDQTLNLPATPFEQVLDNLIASLEQVKGDAIQKYPETKENYQTGRMTQQAIYALLCDMYLWKKDYNNCIKYADLIIEAKKKQAEENEDRVEHDFSDFNDYPLIATKYSGYTNYFGNAFTSIFVEGGSSETIFELTFVKGSEGNMPSNGPVSDFFGGRPEPYVKPSEYVASDISLTTPVIFSNKYDGRAYENFRFVGGGSDPTPNAINKFTVSSNVMLGDPNANSFYTSGSWGAVYPTYGSNYDSRNKSNYIIYRLTDIMLLKAEALSQLMDEGASTLSEKDVDLRNRAFELVTAINKRSLYQATLKDTLQIANYPSKELITDLVYDERERELIFEGKRYFDLVRRAQREGNTKYLRTKVRLKSTENGSVIDSKLTRMEAIYWPYNLDEIKANTNLVQNPAFGSGENSSYEQN